jgi:hypothetical protein
MKLSPLFLLPLVVSLVACSSACENDVLSQATSPSGRLKAVAFTRNCGATTGFNVQVSILASGSRLRNVKGNAFIADQAKLQSLKWIGETLVEVGFSNEPRVFESNSLDGVRVVTSITSL